MKPEKDRIDNQCPKATHADEALKERLSEYRPLHDVQERSDPVGGAKKNHALPRGYVDGGDDKTDNVNLL